MSGPLNGLRVVEMPSMGPVPFAGMLLADLGADVLRLDRDKLDENAKSVGAGFDPFGRGKRSLLVDLKSPQFCETVLRIVEKADVLLEGFRPGTMEVLGLGPDVLLKANPALVIGRMTGWGQTGPLSRSAGHDINFLALTGALHAIGKEHEPPIPPLSLVADFGGGFRYYRLAPSLIVNDRWGNPVINPEYDAAQLAEALAKLEGFAYAPSETRWWQYGHSSERDFIYVTTQNLSAEQLQALSEEVGPDQSLLVCCSAFREVMAAGASERWPNLTLKKIPKMVLARCEWGHDDYSLNVANLPMAAPEPAEPLASSGKKANADRRTADLFGDAAGEGEP